MNIAATDLIAELDNVVKAGSPERGMRILRRVAGHFPSPDADRLEARHIGGFEVAKSGPLPQARAGAA